MAKWTPKQNAFLCEMFAAGAPYPKIVKAIHERFRVRRSHEGVRMQGFFLGLRREGPRPVLTWSDEQNAEIRLRVANKETYPAISAAMGVKFSSLRTQARRLQVIRPSRAALSQEPAKTAEDRAYAVSQAAQERALRKRLNALMNVVPDEYMEPVPFEAVPDPVSDPRNITLMELGRRDCHWITNDDTSAPRYCGHPTDSKKGSWCAAHHDVVRRGTVLFDASHIKWLADTEERRRHSVKDKVPAARSLHFNSTNLTS